MSDLLREGQTGKYQPRKGYGLRLRDVRDHDGLPFVAFGCAMLAGLIGAASNQAGAYVLAEACALVAVLALGYLLGWASVNFLRGV